MPGIEHNINPEWLCPVQNPEPAAPSPASTEEGIFWLIRGRSTSIGDLYPQPRPQEYPLDIPRQVELDRKISELEQKVYKLTKDHAVNTRIDNLEKKRLSRSLDVIVEPDGEGFLARTPDLPLYGYGDDRIEAIDMLKREIESLYEDLIQDDDFSGEYLRIKKYLSEIVL